MSDDDLIVWLRARLDEDERVALAVPRNNWTVYLVGDPEAGEGTDRGILDHVIRHDPDRVLAEVAAKRQILDDHDPDWPRLECPTCCGYDGNDNYGAERRPREAYPCRVVKRLALPHADQPGYREEWRP